MSTQDTIVESKNNLESIRKHYKRIIDNGTLMNDSYMRVFFKDRDCTELMLRVILENKSLSIADSELQKDYKNPRGRSAILDIVAVDSDGKKYDVEVQQESEGASEKRARYHSGALDVNTLNPGEPFEALPGAFVIFITRDDVLGNNFPIYHIHRTIDENGKRFNDDACIIYVNSQIQDDTELGRLMHDFHCKDADEMYNDVFAARTRLLKETSEGVDIMSRELEEIYEAGQESAAKREKISTALRMLADGVNPELVAKYVELALEDVKALDRMQMV
ncbi:MAG: PD-(D/E)XK nuclease family transposase [Lachnospiraceae bacterium]|nr:PD-(D/E)XK nuclease family transposase [Lachnospiraceae bacterium]